MVTQRLNGDTETTTHVLGAPRAMTTHQPDDSSHLSSRPRVPSLRTSRPPSSSPISRFRRLSP